MGFSVEESEAAARKHTVMAHAIDDLLAGKGVRVLCMSVYMCACMYYILFSLQWKPFQLVGHALQVSLLPRGPLVLQNDMHQQTVSLIHQKLKCMYNLLCYLTVT